MDRSRRCWISSFCFFAASRSDASVEFNLVLLATPCRFYLASLVILIVLSLHTFPARFRLCLSFRFRFPCPALSFAFVFPCSCSCSFPPRFPFPRSFPFPVSLSRLPVPSPVRCVPSPSPVPSPCPVFCPASVSLPFPLSRFPVAPVLFFPSGAVCAFVRCACVRSFVVRSFVLVFVRSFVHSFVRVRVRRSFARWDPFPLSLFFFPSCSRPPLVPVSLCFTESSLVMSTL